MHYVTSNLSLVFGPHPSFLQGISCLQILFLWLNFSDGAPFFNISSTSSFTNSSLLGSLFAGKGSLTVKVLNEKEFCILLLCPKLWSPVLFSFKLLQNVPIFLLMERLEYFLTRIISLSMGEPFLIPTEFFFWI